MHMQRQKPSTVHLTITGIVQGVGYREAMRAVALAVGVTGWVRNRADRCVEAVVHGTQEDVETVVAWCHSGPPNARVESVKTRQVESNEVFAAFTTRPST